MNLFAFFTLTTWDIVKVAVFLIVAITLGIVLAFQGGKSKVDLRELETKLKSKNSDKRRRK